MYFLLWYQCSIRAPIKECTIAASPDTNEKDNLYPRILPSIYKTGNKLGWGRVGAKGNAARGETAYPGHQRTLHH